MTTIEAQELMNSVGLSSNQASEIASAFYEDGRNDSFSNEQLPKAMDLVRGMSTENLFELQQFIDGYIEHMVSQFESQMEM
jgi:hypothetical protein